jgi:uncharacterized protein (TIGR00251 family)
MAQQSPISSHREGVVINLVVQPRSSRSEIVGVERDALRVRVTAPPVDGSANTAVAELLCTRLGVPKSSVVILSGASSRHKRVLVRDLDRDVVAALLKIP